MRLVPLSELSDELWEAAWRAMYDPKLGTYVGVAPELLATPPSLVDFYANLMAAHQAGVFDAWAILKDDEFRGHVTLDKSSGEWELGCVLVRPSDWGSGLGVRAALKALKHAFVERGAKQVVAFTQGRDPHVRRILEKGGFLPVYHFWLMTDSTWRQRWGEER